MTTSVGRTSRARYADGYEFQIGRIDMVANTGTYLDTPFHRFADGHDLAGLDLARVAAVPGVLIDASGAQEVDEEQFAGLDVAGRAVLVHTGWSQHWGTERYGDASHPFLGSPPPSCWSTAAQRLSASTRSTSTTPAPASGRSTRCCWRPRSPSSSTCGDSTSSPDRTVHVLRPAPGDQSEWGRFRCGRSPCFDRRDRPADRPDVPGSPYDESPADE